MNMSLQSEIHNFEQRPKEEFAEVTENKTKPRKQVINILKNYEKNKTKYEDCLLQTPYNSNKCVAPTNSQITEEERGKRKINYEALSPPPVSQPTSIDNRIIKEASPRQVRKN
jgi:hypothetical protein